MAFEENVYTRKRTDKQRQYKSPVLRIYGQRCFISVRALNLLAEVSPGVPGARLGRPEYVSVFYDPDTDRMGLTAAQCKDRTVSKVYKYSVSIANMSKAYNLHKTNWIGALSHDPSLPTLVFERALSLTKES